MHSSGLSSVLPKLGVEGIGGGARSGRAGRLYRVEFSVESNGEYGGLVVLLTSLCVVRKLEFDFAVGRREEDGVCDVYSGLSIGVGGHSGFVGSRMGFEMLAFLSTDGVREDRDDEPLPLIDSVSLDHEKDRDPRVGCRVCSVGE
jgi:hypothetical protein